MQKPHGMDLDARRPIMQRVDLTKPVLTIKIPSYNRALYLNELLTSLIDHQKMNPGIWFAQTTSEFLIASSLSSHHVDGAD